MDSAKRARFLSELANDLWAAQFGDALIVVLDRMFRRYTEHAHG